MFLHNLPTIPAPESGLSNRLVAFADLHQPIKISLTPAVAGQAVEAKNMILTVKFFNCAHANHWQSIAISIQAIQTV